MILNFILLVLYTIFTKDEMGDIPFFCPAEYPYSSQEIRTACQIRAANLLLLWISTAISAIIMFLVAIALTIACCCVTKNEEDRSIA